MLTHPELNWLVTKTEKVTYFTTSPCSIPVEKLPRVTIRTGSPPTGDPFPDKLPIGIDATDRAVFLYLVLPSGRDDFRAFLRRHADLFQMLPSWTLRLVFPRVIAHAYAGLQTVVRDELESPLHPKTVEELRWYFEQLRAMRKRRVRPMNERLEHAAEAFERPRFYPLYRQWLKDGDRAFDDISSTVLSDALESGAGRVESLVLPYRYDHLSPLVDIGGSISRSRERGQGKGQCPDTISTLYQRVEPGSPASLAPPRP